jgi:hypothetical protein
MKAKGSKFIKFIGDNHPDPDHCIGSYTEMAKMAEDFAKQDAVEFVQYYNEMAYLYSDDVDVRNLKSWKLKKVSSDL